jgi:hypothetical protein
LNKKNAQTGKALGLKECQPIITEIKRMMD